MTQATRPATMSEATFSISADRLTDTLIVSDVHLGLRTSQPGKLLELLSTWRFRRLILLGDIFHDGACHRFCPESWRLLRFIRRLASEREAEIVWLYGNHDRHLAPLIGVLIGIEVRESFRWVQNGRSFLAVHGDTFDWFNHRFRRLGNAMGAIHAFCLRRLAADSSWPRRIDDWHARVAGLHKAVARRATSFALAHGIDCIVCGHTHHPAEERYRTAGGAEVVYLNAGSWVDLPASFLTVDAAGVRLQHAW